MSPSIITADRAALAALGRRGRPPAVAAGLRFFIGHTCPVRGHGGMRRLSDSRCADCLEEVVRVKQQAQEAGKAAALKLARAQVVREQKAAERQRIKEEAAAVRAQQKADMAKAAKAAERARKRAERKAPAAPQEPQPVALEAAPWDVVTDLDDSPPWE